MAPEQPEQPPGAGAEDAGADDACAGCGAPAPPRHGGTQVVRGAVVVREIGSCRACGLQLVRFAGEPWREIRG